MVKETQGPVVTPILYYFPHLAGHVAIGGFKSDSKLAPSGYLSYGHGRGKVKEPNKGFYPVLEQEINTYNGACVAIPLPACDSDVFNKALSNFAEMDRGDYRLLWRNCATAAINFLKDAGYINRNEKFMNPTLPLRVANRACDMILKNIAEARASIKTQPSQPLTKIQDLIANDIQRLEALIKKDEIKKIFFMRTISQKQAKIEILKETASKLKVLSENDMTGAANVLTEAASKLNSKTGANIKDCLALLPAATLSAEIKQETKDLKSYRKERASILTDGELDNAEMTQKLVENNINILKLQFQQDRPRTFFTAPNILHHTMEIVQQLAAVNQQLLSTPPDYEAALAALREINKEPKAVLGGVSLNKCISNFPYNKLENIDQRREFLVKMDVILQREYAEKKGVAIVGHVVPQGIRELRSIIPDEESIYALSDKEVFEKFTKAQDLLAVKKNEFNVNRDPLIQESYTLLDEMAKAVVAPRKTL